jgi:hypothetical protein
MLYMASGRMPNESPEEQVVINKHCKWIIEGKVWPCLLARECSKNLIRIPTADTKGTPVAELMPG